MRHRRVLLALALGLLAVTAGCAQYYEERGIGDRRGDGGGGTDGGAGTPTADGGDGADGSDADGNAGDGEDGDPVVRPDPDEDRIGWENGRWYDEPLSVTPEDGLNESELAAVVDRTMARVERIRGLEFEKDVEVRVISREEFRETNTFDLPEDPFRNQVYEALFLVDERTSSAEAFEAIYGGSVGGYYYQGQIVLVSENASGPVTVDRATLAHELTHALQDQQLTLRSGGIGGTDGIAALRSLTEGEANYVQDRYEERCGEEWNCLPAADSGGGSRDINRGLFLTVFVPYSDGPTFVADLIERDGWPAVTEAYERPPVSTEQVIHPEKYPDEKPIEVQIEDRSADEWEPVVTRGRGATTVGEAGIFAMFWANGVVPRDSLFSGPDSRYNYSHPASTGWGGDQIRAYSDGESFAYVFRTAWDSERDAREFVAAYRDLLEGRDAVEVRDGVYRIEDGGFADAFRVVRAGTTVTIVNAPTVDDLDEVHGPGGSRASVSASSPVTTDRATARPLLAD